MTGARVLALAYLSLMPFAWPALPGGLHVVDVFFPVLAILVVRSCAHKWRWTLLDYCVLAYLLAHIPSLLVTDNVQASSIELLKRMYLAGVYVVFTLYFRADGCRLAVRALSISTVAVCIGSLAVLLGYMLWGMEVAPAVATSMQMPVVGSVLRLRGGTESWTMFGNYLAFALPFLCAGPALGLVGRRTWVLQMLGVSAAMVFTVSHAVSGFAVAALVMAWPLLRRYRVAGRWAAVAVVLLVVCVMNVLAAVAIRRVDVQSDKDPSVGPPAYHYVAQSAQGAERLSVRVSYNVMGYLLLKQIAWREFLQHPWTGVGAGRFNAATERAYVDGRIHVSYRNSDPHSTLFGALAETGIIGTAATAALLVAAVWGGRREDQGPQRWVVLAGYAALCGLAVNSLNVDIMNFRFLWVAFAVLRS